MAAERQGIVRARRAVAAFTATAVFAALAPLAAWAQAPQKRPLAAGDFALHAPRAFGDRANSWAQSMAWWNDHLYVGTGREALCSSLFAIWSFAGGVFGREFADTWLPYPPRDPELPCVPDGADLPLQAEIWRWAPQTDTWERVFQSALELDNPGTGPPAPPRTGKKLPYDITFRGMTGFTEPDGTSALYAFGVNSTVMWDRNQLPPPRILRSTDGITFTPLPQTPGTFLGDLPFNPDHSSFRSPVSHEGKLFVLSGPVFGQGTLIGSADPAKGDDAWFVASPPDIFFYEMASYNGWLYLGTFDPFGTGYAVVKTRTDGPPPYQFVTVVPGGGYLPERPSRSVVSMHVYRGKLYVGTATQTEIIRINPDDTWDLVIGSPRAVPKPDGSVEIKSPLSGLDAGFGHSLNDHAWQMEMFDGRLYIGTYNACTGAKEDPVNGPLLAHIMGAHLYYTDDGWYFNAVTTNGFATPNDPQGGRYDYGIRTMATTPHGLFMGTTNDHHGLAVYRATGPASTGPEPPARLEVQTSARGGALLSWQAGHLADTYDVYRAEVQTILVRDDINFENWTGAFGNKIPDTYILPYQMIGTFRQPSFRDDTVEPGRKYMYYVTRARGGEVSEQSNLVAFPLLSAPVGFDTVLDRIAVARQRRSAPQRARPRLHALRAGVLEAQRLAAQCQISQAIWKIHELKDSRVRRDGTDLEVLLSRLQRRLRLYSQSPRDFAPGEFCTSAPERRWP
jgi:hypothetical protein